MTTTPPGLPEAGWLALMAEAETTRVDPWQWNISPRWWQLRQRWRVRRWRADLRRQRRATR